MNEAFLHHVWKFQRFDAGKLTTTKGEDIAVFFQGNHNQDAGPDFTEARIQIGEIEWVGNVEIHVHSTDWLHHNHSADPNYNTVILHVVYRADKEIQLENGNHVAQLELGSRISKDLISSYHNLINTTAPIPCASYLPTIDNITIASMITGKAIERMELKANRVLKYIDELPNWEEICYQQIGRAFGSKINVENFDRLLQHTPLKLIRKYRNDRSKVYAILYGQAGFLDKPVDDYQDKLYQEYTYLCHKHSLLNPLSRFHWKFSKLRPASFPTVRLSQFISLLITHNALFQKIIALKSLLEVKQLFQPSLDPYWQSHYDFGKKSKQAYKPGLQFINTVTINAIVPLMTAYGIYIGDPKLKEQALQLLEQMVAENNRILRGWKDLHINATNALESQGLIHQYNNYCLKKKCLSCPIGINILRKA